MRWTACIPALGMAALTILPTPLGAEVVYREGEGWSIEDSEGLADAESAAEQMAVAREAENQNNLRRSLAAYSKVVKRFPRTEQAMEAQYRMGELYERAGDFSRAFEAYKNLVENYPDTDRFNEAIESQFEIAKLYLEGERQRVLGIPTLPSMARAQEMFEAIIKNAPYTKFAPLSQFNIGIAYQKQSKPAEAIASFQTVIDRYPDSDVADDAQYQIAYVWFEQARTGSYDQTVAAKARESFQDFLLRYPDSEKVAQAEENLKLLEDKKTERAIDIARFYDKSGQPKAAVIYYNLVIQQEPDSEVAEEASQRIEEIRSEFGEEALMVGGEIAETGSIARQRRRMQAEVDTASRADYAGPPAPVIPDELPPEQPRMRTSPEDIEPLPPAVEPDLPTE